MSQPKPFELSIVCRAGRQFAPYLRKHLLDAHRLLKTPLRELSLALVGDKEMADLHVQFMNIPGPTDVLTFPLDQDDRGRDIAGEVVVCVPEARRQSTLNKTPVEKELLLYALHGILHLSGFDDRTQAEFRKMHRKEDEILAQLGIGPVFSRPPAVTHLAVTPPATRPRAKAIRKSKPRRRVAGDI